MKKKKLPEEQADLGRWLLTYADLITLLLGLFVILYSMSKVDLEKYAAIAQEMNKLMGSGKTILPGNPISPPSIIPLPAQGSRLDTLQNEIMEGLKDLPESEGVSFEKTQFGLVMHFKERLLFELGKADLKPVSHSVLQSISKTLINLPNEILIEGHTDTIPINTPQFPSNMHLSTYRAMNTMLYLTEACGLSRDKLSVRGYGEYKPMAPNNSDSNRAKNRRVDIVIVNEEEKEKKNK